MCVFDRLDASEAQSVLCLSVLERAAHAHARAHTRANTHTSAWETAFLVQIVLSTFYYQTCPANLVTVKTAFYNNRQTIDLILTDKQYSGAGGADEHHGGAGDHNEGAGGADEHCGGTR